MLPITREITQAITMPITMADFPNPGAPSDPNFSSVSLLLPGNGTNGAQNNTFLDSSANNFTITRNGNTTQGTFSPFSQTGWSNYFDGSGDFLTLASNTALDMGTGNFTVEMWVYSTDASVDTQNRRFFATETNGSGSIQLGHVTTTTGVAQYCDNGSLGALITGTTNILNQWAHIAAVRSGTTVTLYVNGVSEGTATDSGNKTSTAFTIGKYPGASGHLKGWLGSLRVVKGTAVYTSNFTPPTAPLTAISGTSLLTCQSNRFIDNSTNNLTITPNGDVSVQAFSPFNPTAAWSAATNGGSGYFDGNGDQLDLANNAAFELGSGDFSYEAWVYALRLTNTFAQGIISYGVAGSTGSSTCTLDINNVGNLQLAYATGASPTLTDPASFPISQWVHVVACRSGTTLSMFVNGSRKATATTSATVGTGGTMTIGGQWFANASTRQLQGYIASARVTKGSSPYDATQSSITVPTAPLTAITNTSLLLNFTNGAIYDAAAKNDLETVGNAQTSTAQSKWGGSSMYFDGTGDWLRCNGNTAPVTYTGFGTGNFTIEAWVYCTSSASANNGIFDARYSAAATGPLVYYIPGTGLFMFYNGSNQISGGTFTINTWTHVALVRSSSVSRLYINGTQTGSNYADTNDYTSGVNSGFVGTFYDGTGNWNGYIQDLRITNSVARYTSNFTPPTAPFPVR